VGFVFEDDDLIYDFRITILGRSANYANRKPKIVIRKFYQPTKGVSPRHTHLRRLPLWLRSWLDAGVPT